MHCLELMPGTLWEISTICHHRCKKGRDCRESLQQMTVNHTGFPAVSEPVPNGYWPVRLATHMKLRTTPEHRKQRPE